MKLMYQAFKIRVGCGYRGIRICTISKELNYKMLEYKADLKYDFLVP